MQDPAIYDNERRFIFSNFSKEDFVTRYGGEEKTIKSGETWELPMFKAYLFTKHLVDREMIKNRLENSLSSEEARKPYEDMAMAEITGNVDSPALASLKEKIAEEVAVESGIKRKKKITPKDSKTATVEVKEFEDIS